MASRTKTRTAASNAVEVSESNKRALEEIGEAVLAEGDVIVLEALVDKDGRWVTAEAVVNEVDKIDLTFEQWCALLREVPGFDTYEVREIKPMEAIKSVKEEIVACKVEPAATVRSVAQAVANVQERPSSPRSSTTPASAIRARRTKLSPMLQALEERKTKGSAAAFDAARQPSTELVSQLTAYGIESMAVAIGKAGITSVRALKLHTVDQLEQSLMRPTVSGKKYELSDFQRQALVELCSPPKAVAALGHVWGEEDEDGGLGDALLAEADDGSLNVKPKVKQPAAGGIDSTQSKWAVEVAKACTPDESPHAYLLMGQVPADEWSVSKLASMTNSLAEALLMQANVKVAEHAKLEDVVDALDILLKKVVTCGVLSAFPSGLVPPSGANSMRAVSRHFMAVKIAIGEMKQSQETKPKAADSQMGELAKVLAQTRSSPRLTAAEDKVSEQITASATRLERVADNESSRRVLSTLAVDVESDISDALKLKAFSTAIEADVRVAELLKASHVKEPRGEECLVMPYAPDCVKWVKAARNGVARAAKNVLRRLLTHDADVAELYTAAFAGSLLGEGESALDVSNLIKPNKPKAWLAIKADSTKISSKAEQLAILFLAMPVLMQALAMLNPHDSTIPLTLAEAFSTMAKGIRLGSVQDAIDSVIVPLLRTYGESWDLFQKSSSLSMPMMQAAWLHEKLEPTLASYITRIGSAPLAAAQPADDSKVKELESRVRSLTDRVEHLNTKDMTDEEKKTYREAKSARGGKGAKGAGGRGLGGGRGTGA